MTEQDLGRRLAEIAREIEAADSVHEAAEEIVAATMELLPQASGAAVTLVHHNRRVETAAASGDLAREGDRLQYELGEGPCLRAAREEELVFVPDLEADDRWPQWGPRVTALGVRSMLCVQLFTNDDQLGALNVYADTAGAFGAEDCETAQFLAAHAAVGVAAAREIATLKVAVDRRTTIGKALGIVMVQYGLDDDQAMSALRRLSTHHNRKLYDLALEIIRELRLPHAVVPQDGAVKIH